MAVTIKNPVTIIKQGGGGKIPSLDDPIRFFDYDGTLLYSYTAAEAAQLTSLPTPPIHAKMATEGWTHTLAEVVGSLYLDVGAVYHSAIGTDDTSWFEFYPNASGDVTINFRQSVDSGVEIDWGDGSATERVSGTGVVSATHTYAQATLNDYPYTLMLTPDSGTDLELGGGTTSTKFVPVSSWSDYGAPQRGLIGRAKLSAYAFQYSPITDLVLSPRTTASFGGSSLSRMDNLKALIVPFTLSSASAVPASALEYTQGLNVLVQVGNNILLPRISLKNIVIPTKLWNTSTTIDLIQFSANALSAVRFKKPEVELTTNYRIHAPEKAGVLDFREFTEIPGLITIRTWAPADYTKIVVPDSLYEDWTTTTGWVDFAGHFVKASDYEG